MVSSLCVYMCVLLLLCVVLYCCIIVGVDVVAICSCTFSVVFTPQTRIYLNVPYFDTSPFYAFNLLSHPSPSIFWYVYCSPQQFLAMLCAFLYRYFGIIQSLIFP